MRPIAHQRTWIPVALGAIGAAISWSAVGLLGVIAGIGAIFLAATERSAAARGTLRRRIAATGLVLGGLACVILAALAAITIINAIADGTFERD